MSTYRLAGRIWPDHIEWDEDQQGKPTNVVFVVEKGNNRHILPDKMMVLRVLEQLGLDVKVEFNGQKMSLDEFTNGGAFRMKYVINRQALYNARSELKFMASEYATMKEDDPRRLELETRILAKQKILGLVAEQMHSKPEELQEPITPPVNPRLAEMIERGRKLREEIHDEQRQGGTGEETVTASSDGTGNPVGEKADIARKDGEGSD